MKFSLVVAAAFAAIASAAPSPTPYDPDNVPEIIARLAAEVACCSMCFPAGGTTQCYCVPGNC
jgi:hypothetical protein